LFFIICISTILVKIPYNISPLHYYFVIQGTLYEQAVELIAVNSLWFIVLCAFEKSALRKKFK